MQKLQEVAFPRKDQLKKLLHEKYNREHAEYLRSQVSTPLATWGALGLHYIATQVD